MAGGSATVRIDQVLHGYDRGHRELSSSIALDDQSRATMLVNSDLLADLNAVESSYLTCYPLPNASRHVLARTWLAGKGYRPGSVWTHSLVLDFQALAVLQDLAALDAWLMHAGDIERARPLKAIDIDSSSVDHPDFTPGPNAVSALYGLYCTTNPTISVPRLSNAENEALALALWRQMWPSLRREFSFVTGASAERSAAGTDWMLRFSLRPREEIDLTTGLRALLEDLPKPSATPLRTFLSRYAVEAPNPRAVGEPLAKFWASPPLSVAERLRAVRAVDEQVPLVRLSRDIMTRELRDAVDPEALLVVVKEFGNHDLDIDPSMAIKSAEMMSAASLRSLLDFGARAPRNALGSRIFAAVVEGTSAPALADAADGSTRDAMVQLRPDLLRQRNFWPADDESRSLLVNNYARPDDMSSIWHMLGGRIGVKTAEALLHRDPDPPLPVTLNLLNDGDPAVCKLVAEHMLALSTRVEPLLAQAELNALEHLGDAQIALGRLPATPAAWCKAVDRFEAARIGASTLVIGYVAASMVGGEPGLATAGRVYDPLQRLIRRYRLPTQCERYLQSAISDRVQGWGLADRLTRSALARWPVGPHNAGALVLSSDYGNFRDLIDEALKEASKTALRRALSDPAVPPAVQIYLRSRLDPPTRKSWWF